MGAAVALTAVLAVIAVGAFAWIKQIRFIGYAIRFVRDGTRHRVARAGIIFVACWFALSMIIGVGMIALGNY